MYQCDMSEVLLHRTLQSNSDKLTVPSVKGAKIEANDLVFKSWLKIGISFHVKLKQVLFIVCLLCKERVKLREEITLV